MSTTLHAHRCQACKKLGKDVFWIHSDDCAVTGKECAEERLRKTQAHKCPECGAVEWKKALIDPAAIPQKPQLAQKNNLDAILGYVILFIGLAMLAYAAYLYIEKKRQPEKKETE